MTLDRGRTGSTAGGTRDRGVSIRPQPALGQSISACTPATTSGVALAFPASGDGWADASLPHQFGQVCVTRCAATDPVADARASSPARHLLDRRQR